MNSKNYQCRWITAIHFHYQIFKNSHEGIWAQQFDNLSLEASELQLVNFLRESFKEVTHSERLWVQHPLGAASSGCNILRVQHPLGCPFPMFWLRAPKWLRPAFQMVENWHVRGRCGHGRFCCLNLNQHRALPYVIYLHQPFICASNISHFMQ